MIFRNVVLCLLLSLPLLGQGIVPRGEPVDGFAAEVDGYVITIRDVIEASREEMKEAMQKHQGSQADMARKQNEVFNTALDRLIEQRLLVAKFEQMGAQLPPNSIRDRKETILRDRFENDRTELMRVLRLMGITEEEWEEQLRVTIIQQTMVQEFIQGKVQVAPAEIREAYEAMKTDLQTDVELKLRAIALRPAREGQELSRKQKIETIERLLDEGAEFADMAIEYSEGPKASRGGDQGWIKPGTLPAALSGPLLAAKTGEVLGPIELPSQTYFFLLESKRGGERQSLAEAQAGIEAQLRSEKYDRLRDQWMRGLRTQFPVHLYNPDISSITGQ